MEELEPPSHSLQDILDGVSPSTSSQLTAGCPHTASLLRDTQGLLPWETNPTGHGCISCGISELIQITTRVCDC